MLLAKIACHVSPVFKQIGVSDLVVGVSDIIRESDICEDCLFWIFCVLCIGVSDLEVGVSDVGSESLMSSEVWLPQGRSDRPREAV